MKNIIVYAIAAVFILAATTLILTAGSADKAVGKAEIEACCDSEHAHAAAHDAEEACCDSEHAHAAAHEAEEACCDSEHAHAAAHDAEEACCDSEHTHAAAHEAEEACCDGEKDAALTDHDACGGNCQG